MSKPAGIMTRGTVQPSMARNASIASKERIWTQLMDAPRSEPTMQSSSGAEDECDSISETEHNGVARISGSKLTDHRVHASVDPSVDDAERIEQQASLPESIGKDSMHTELGCCLRVLTEEQDPHVQIGGDADAVSRMGGWKAVFQVMGADCEASHGR